MSAVRRHNSTFSDVFYKRIYCVIWLTLYTLESVGCYSGKKKVLSVWADWNIVLRRLATIEAHVIIQHVLYKVILYIIWPWLHRCLPSPCL